MEATSGSCCGHPPQHDGLAGREAEKVLVIGTVLPEVTALEEHGVAQSNGALAGAFVAGVVRQHHVLHEISSHVGQSDFDGVNNDKAPLCLRIKLLAAALLENIHRRPHLAPAPGHPDDVAERVESLGGVAAAAPVEGIRESNGNRAT